MKNYDKDKKMNLQTNLNANTNRKEIHTKWRNL